MTFFFLCSWCIYFPLKNSRSPQPRTNGLKFKCPHNQRRECRPCYSCLLVFRATTHRKSPTQKAAYPLLLSEQRHHCDPHLLLCGMWKGQQSPLILSWRWWGTAVLLMRFFSRSAIYIWDRHSPYTPQLAIELVELMQEREGGSLLEKTVPLSLDPHPFNHLQPKQQHTDHFDTVNQLSSVLPRHQFRPMWAPCPLISSLLSFPAAAQ